MAVQLVRNESNHYAKAVAWYRKAAEQRSTSAQNNSPSILLTNYDLTQDIRKQYPRCIQKGSYLFCQ